MPGVPFLRSCAASAAAADDGPIRAEPSGILVVCDEEEPLIKRLVEKNGASSSGRWWRSSGGCGESGSGRAEAAHGGATSVLEHEQPPALTQDELEQLVKATVAAHGEAEVSKEQLDRVLSWAIGARAEAAMLDLVLRGRATVRVREDGELVFALAE